MNVVGMIEGVSNQMAIDMIVDEKSYLPRTYFRHI